MEIQIPADQGWQTVDIYSSEGMEILSQLCIKASFAHKRVYKSAFLGIPIIQMPEEIILIQEKIWQLKPDVIVETGIAHGGSAILYASVLQLIGKGKVVAIDVDIRRHNRAAIEKHPLSHRIELIEGTGQSLYCHSRIFRKKSKLEY